ncbi:MAG: HEAT repeat domain-containing protein [Planctomycetes bacterium]|nr:HEAT repeat domain-containing protein [Planctomycetota bacterium]
MRPVQSLLFALVVSLAAACTSWQPVETREAWTLYTKPGYTVDIACFARALEPAFVAVEERMGPFRKNVRIHALAEAAEGGLEAEAQFETVPGIGPARVRAFHVRATANPFQSGGVFLECADTGAAVHELVHARVAEEGVKLPLWFEEGLAQFYGDGAVYEDRWYVDGLCCWPLRELREERLSDTDLERLLAVRGSDSAPSRDNLLVHFIGWAIVFDLAREAPNAAWHQWYDAWRADDSTAAARARIERTIADRSHVDWLKRLDDEDPGVRFATAKGTWKLRSASAAERLLARLDDEEEPTVRFALALNVLITGGEARLSGRQWGRFGRLVFSTLRSANLADPAEAQSLELVRRALRGRTSKAESDRAFDGLARYWDE